MDPEYVIAIVAIVSLFIVFPGMVFHYITLWRKQKTLQPDDERIMEDLWRTAKAMERRIETLESLLNTAEAEAPRAPPRRPSSTFDD